MNKIFIISTHFAPFNNFKNSGKVLYLAKKAMRAMIAYCV